jgi:hypothetical protein
MVVERFLAADRADWLFWIDTDMGFAADTGGSPDGVRRPDRTADRRWPVLREREVEVDGLGGVSVPAPCRRSTTGVNTKARKASKPPRPSLTPELIRCGATGSACLLVHRSAFEAIGAGWYDPIRNPSTGSPMGEDLSFCVRAGARQISVHVATGVRTSHLKPIWLQAEHFQSAS